MHSIYFHSLKDSGRGEQQTLIHDGKDVASVEHNAIARGMRRGGAAHRENGSKDLMVKTLQPIDLDQELMHGGDYLLQSSHLSE